MWYVENITGKEEILRVYFNTYEEAKRESEWTFGSIGYETEKNMENIELKTSERGRKYAIISNVDE